MRIGMIPYVTGDEWETNGNPHLVRIVKSLNKLGWEVVGLNSDDFVIPSRLTDKEIDIIFIHWPSSIFDLDVFSRQTFFGKCVQAIKARIPRYIDSGFHRILKAVLNVGLMPIQWLHYTCTTYFAVQTCNSIIKTISSSGLPVIWEIHDLGSHHVSNQMVLAKIEHNFFQNIYNACSGVVVHESSCLDPIAQEYGGLRPHVIAELGSYSYGAPVDRGEARQRLGITTSGKVFAYIGTGRPNRNPLNTINSFKRVAAGKDRLVVAGTGIGPYIPDELSDPRIIVINRYLAPEELRDVFCSADFVINDGVRYLTSAVIRAAMGYGVPVIAFPYGAALDMAQNAALFIGDGGLDEIFVEALHMDQGRYELLCREALKRDAERSWEMTGVKLDRFLRRFVGPLIVK